MANISKEQIEQAIEALNTHPDHDTENVNDEAVAMLQGLLAQPEQDPVAWIWKYQDGSEEVVFVKPHRLDPEFHDIPSSIIPLYTHPAPFTPITAGMVTKEMLIDIFPKSYSSLDNTVHNRVKSDIANIYNAVGKYMGAKK
jgi:hypothetical protein